MTRKLLDEEVRREGLVFLGVVSLEISQDYERFSSWLAKGHHAGMAFLEQYSHCRENPSNILEGAKVAIVIALPYDLGDAIPDGNTPQVAQYARFADYHKLLRKKGEKIAERFLSHVEGKHVARVVVDTAPVLERALASQTMQGFIGKNTCYIHPTEGSFLLLGEIFTSIPLQVDEKTPIDPTVHLPEGGCGACKECQVHCPTGALDSEYQLDSNRCLAYWTIENRGTIPEQYWPWLKYYYFGCDICQIVCPFNLKKRDHRLPADISVRKMPGLFQVATMNQSEYEQYFGGTPLTRAKRSGLRRNALIAMTVTEDPQLDEALERARSDSMYPLSETVEQIIQWRTREHSRS